MFYYDSDYPARTSYDLARFIGFDSTGYDALSSALLEHLNSLPVAGYYEVTAEEARPDLVSHRIYGHTGLWWALLYYNRLSWFGELSPGTQLRYFSMDDFSSMALGLKKRERTRT